jgi:hypothetical protein
MTLIKMSATLPKSMSGQLERETQVFESHVEEWRRSHLGQFVLIRGDEVIGFYPSLEKAFAVGTGRFGLEPFLVRPIVPKDAVNISLFGRRLHTA